MICSSHWGRSSSTIYPYFYYLLVDNLRMNCLPVCLSNVCGPGLHRKLWGGFLQVKRRWLSLPDLPGIISVVVYNSGSVLLSYPLSFLSRFLERLVRSLVYLLVEWVGLVLPTPTAVFDQGPTVSCGVGLCTQETLTKLPRSTCDPSLVV